MNPKMSGLAAHHPEVSRHMAMVSASGDGSDESRTLSAVEKQRFIRWLGDNDAVLLAHYYTPDVIQQLALDTGGLVSDSLEMARFGQSHPARTLVVAGVRFMAETAKILSPEKRVLVLDERATCSLDIGCPAEEFAAFCDLHPDRTVVVYANTSAAVKARSDWVVTSSIAVEVVEYLADRKEKILWAPDKHLGAHIQHQTGADMKLWDGACVVHEEFRAEGIRQLQAIHPDAAVLAHPEAPRAVLDMADAIGSTSHLVYSARELPHPVMIVATDRGLFHSMRRAAPDKEFLQAPSHGQGATCRSCGSCPWMAMNAVQKLPGIGEGSLVEVQVQGELCDKARLPLERMVQFRQRQQQGKKALTAG